MKFLLLTLLITTSAMAKVRIMSVYGDNALGDIIKAFTAQTGIEIELVTGKSTELLAKLPNVQADLYLDKDVIYMNQAQRMNVLSKINPSDFPVREKFFDNKREWMLFFYRTRTLAYNTNLVGADELTSYFDLGKKDFEGKVCMREAKSSYNKAWAGYMLANHDSAEVYELLGNIAKNAVKPLFTSDRDMIRALAAETCKVALINSYYLPGFIKKDPNFPVSLKFVDQKVGTHANGLALAMLKSSTNKAQALKFMQFMTSVEVQNQVGQAFEQYPVNPKATWSETLSSFGAFNIDFNSLSSAAYYQSTAFELMTNQGL